MHLSLAQRGQSRLVLCVSTLLRGFVKILKTVDKSNQEQQMNSFMKAMEGYSRIALTAPAAADGDSVGTQSALLEILKAKFPHKQIRIVNEEPIPERYKFLPLSKHFELSEVVLAEAKNSWPEVMIVVDGGASRIGEHTEKLWEAAKSRGQLDHHAYGGGHSGEKYDFAWVDAAAASTTTLVYRLLKHAQVPLTQSIAQAIHVGLVFDTGQFKHSNTTSETLSIAAELLKTGFNHTRTVELAMLVRTPGSFRLLQALLAQAQFEMDGRYVWSGFNHERFLQANASPDDREGLIDVLFLTDRCSIAAMFFERKPGEWKISFRSRGPNVAALAQQLSPAGGGHVLASGCTLHGSEEEVLKKCHGAVRDLLRQSDREQ